MEMHNVLKLKEALRLINYVLDDEDDFPLSLEHAKDQLQEALEETK